MGTGCAGTARAPWTPPAPNPRGIAFSTVHPHATRLASGLQDQPALQAAWLLANIADGLTEGRLGLVTRNLRRHP
jgi:hypothetical protein